MNYMQKRAALKKVSTLRKAAAAVLLIKLAADDKPADDKPAATASTNPGFYPALYGGLGSAALGGIAGSFVGDEKDRLRNILLGVLGMGTLGAGIGYGTGTLMGKKAPEVSSESDSDAALTAYRLGGSPQAPANIARELFPSSIEDEVVLPGLSSETLYDTAGNRVPFYANTDSNISIPDTGIPGSISFDFLTPQDPSFDTSVSPRTPIRSSKIPSINLNQPFDLNTIR